jgi:hypothetical protein
MQERAGKRTEYQNEQPPKQPPPGSHYKTQDKNQEWSSLLLLA